MSPLRAQLSELDTNNNKSERNDSFAEADKNCDVGEEEEAAPQPQQLTLLPQVAAMTIQAEEDRHRLGLALKICKMP